MGDGVGSAEAPPPSPTPKEAGAHPGDLPAASLAGEDDYGLQRDSFRTASMGGEATSSPRWALSVGCVKSIPPRKMDWLLALSDVTFTRITTE